MGRYEPATASGSNSASAAGTQTDNPADVILAGSFPGGVSRSKVQVFAQLTFAGDAASDPVQGAYGTANANVKAWDGTASVLLNRVTDSRLSNESVGAVFGGPFDTVSQTGLYSVVLTDVDLGDIELRIAAFADSNDGEANISASVSDWYINTRRRSSSITLP
jgi:hypothetical protein